MLKIISDDFIETTNGKLDVNEITYYIENYELDNHNGNIPLIINHPNLNIELLEEEVILVEPFDINGILPNIYEHTERSYILITALDPYLLLDGKKKMSKDLTKFIEAWLINLDDIHMDIYLTLSDEIIAKNKIFETYID